MSSNWEANEHDTTTSTKPKGVSSLVFWTLLAVVAGGLLAYLLFSNHKRETQEGVSHPAVGSSLSKLSLEPLTGATESVRLDDVRGQVALVNYWGTWCPPCRIEFPQLAALEKGLRENADFRYLSVSCGSDPSDEDPAEIKVETAAFLKAAKADHATYLDAGGTSRLALIQTAELQGFAYPTTVLIGRDGKLRALWIGYAPTFEREIEVAVREALADKGQSGKK